MSENVYRLTIQLSQEEKDALIILAKRRGRDPKVLVRQMIRRSLQENRLIPWNPDIYYPMNDQLPE